MRVFFTWRAWLCAGLISLPCLSLTGCKSTGTGGSWLSWMSPKPSTTALASAVPTKPSVNLPAPSATTGTPPAGTTGLASAPTAPATAAPASPAAAPANSYYTGPYGMAGQTPNTLPAASGTGYAATGYSATPPAQTNPASSYGGYPGSYQSSATAPSNAYRTADTRSGATGGTASGYPTSPAGSAYGAPGSTNPSVAAGGSTWNRTPQQPASYGAPSAAPGAWGSNPVAAAPRETSLDPSGASAATGPVAQTAAVPARPGAFRPGSTARNTGVLPVSTSAAVPSAAPGTYSASAATYPTTSAAPSAYPASAYPATTYPGTEPAARTAMPTTGYNSGYSYPSTTTQTR